MRRMFWLGVGIAAGVALSRKASNTARQATPAGLASNLADAMRELANAAGAFGAEVRAGMTEREQELHDTVEQRTGVPTRHGDTQRGRHAYSADRVADRAARQARAPQADG
ncbi:MAG: hypothetical protein GEV04_06790 [Actinophytocola sp.]|nr:hypothetical protein [Actinophytocola sp.]